ncbi:Acyl-coenzyme A thioesterase 11 [Micractinium conductrix]|uniref:Acyl-coenzyme A thioesterase 11 n=1 Tax=Micractinium conductrix TaxID=554055 RepID=A0A2P6V9G3_9CHLO|nr:Acyl-coenzyme A thioesterase 11 [Micractinium conductrix]|eukprot:PSC70724.1 Acyl-coenzyme A thioesterase 11 [Micractinium conductrix]
MTRETPGAAAAPELLQAQLAEALQQLHALGARMTGLEARMTGAEASRGGDGGATAGAASNGECERSPPPAPRSLAGSGSMDFLQSHQQLVLPQPGPGQRIPGRGRGGGAPTAADALLPRLPGRPPLAPSSTLAVPHEAEVPMATTRMVMAQIVSPGDSMGLDVCTGGTVLSWVDICAGLAAKTFARGPCVTASVDAVHFLRPCHVGSVVIIAAMVNRTFRSSMEVGVRVEEEDSRTGARHHCCSAYLTFVALSKKDPEGGPSPKVALPKVVPTDRHHEQIHAEAARRRDSRLAAREHMRACLEQMASGTELRLRPITHAAGQPTLPPALRVDPKAEGCKHSISPVLTSAHLTQMVLPQHANSIGITFGGQVMRWMEQCAFIAASRVCRGGYLLTAAMDSISFLNPTRVGDTVYVEGQVTAIFGSSVEVQISLWGETPDVGVMFHCGDAYATVVSVNRHKKPVDIPFELVPESEAECLRLRLAVQKRAERLALRDRMRARRKIRVSLDGQPRYDSDSGSDGEKEAMRQALSNATSNASEDAAATPSP